MDGHSYCLTFNSVFFCRENPVQRNVHFLRFHIAWVYISRHKKKKITIQCMKLLCNCKKQKERRSKKRKINNRFLGTKAFSSIYFFLHSLNVDRWYFFMFVQSSVRRKMKTCEKERKKNCTHTPSVQCCALGIPSASFNTISLVVCFKWFLFCCCHIGMCDPSFLQTHFCNILHT